MDHRWFGSHIFSLTSWFENFNKESSFSVICNPKVHLCVEIKVIHINKKSFVSIFLLGREGGGGTGWGSNLILVSVGNHILLSDITMNHKKDSQCIIVHWNLTLKWICTVTNFLVHHDNHRTPRFKWNIYVANLLSTYIMWFYKNLWVVWVPHTLFLSSETVFERSLTHMSMSVFIGGGGRSSGGLYFGTSTQTISCQCFKFDILRQESNLVPTFQSLFGKETLLLPQALKPFLDWMPAKTESCETAWGHKVSFTTPYWMSRKSVNSRQLGQSYWTIGLSHANIRTKYFRRWIDFWVWVDNQTLAINSLATNMPHKTGLSLCNFIASLPALDGS